MIKFEQIPHLEFDIQFYEMIDMPIDINIGLVWLSNNNFNIDLRNNLIKLKDITIKFAAEENPE